MAVSVIEGALHVRGQLTAESQIMAAGSVDNTSVAASAGIDATKLDHQYVVASVQAGTPAAITDPVHRAYAAGQIVSASVWVDVKPTAGSSYVVDLKKNGTTVLTGTLTVDSTSTEDTAITLTLSDDDYVAGDRLDVVVGSLSGGAYGTGLHVRLVLREAAGTP